MLALFDFQTVNPGGKVRLANIWLKHLAFDQLSSLTALLQFGNCYEWVSKDDPDGDKYDIVLEDGFMAKWNFNNTLFAIAPDSFDQVGCIHTTQGLEFDYCGIIIGPDLRYENGKVITDQSKEAISDRTSGIRTCRDRALADKLIRNTYKTLMSRGQKGCYLYCEDKELLKYISKMLNIKITE